MARFFRGFSAEEAAANTNGRPSHCGEPMDRERGEPGVYTCNECDNAYTRDGVSEVQARNLAGGKLDFEI